MGFQDRDYYREDDLPEAAAMTPRTMIANILIVNVLVFLIDTFTQTSDGYWFKSLLALKTQTWHEPWNLWQVVTYGFAHSSFGERYGLWHILGNMLMLWMFGREVEEHYGRREFLTFYLTAIVFSGVVWLGSRVIQGQPGSIVGASGAVTAVFILFAFNFPKRVVYLWGILAMPAWMLGVFLIGSDLIRMLNGESGVAFEAHLAGAVFGGLYYRLGWNLSRFLPGGGSWRRLRRPKLRVHREEPDEMSATEEEEDRILVKVGQSGIDSLSSRERRILDAYSRRMRRKLR